MLPGIVTTSNKILLCGCYNQMMQARLRWGKSPAPASYYDQASIMFVTSNLQTRAFWCTHTTAKACDTANARLLRDERKNGALSSHEMAAEDMVWGRPASLLGRKAYLDEDRQVDVSPYTAPTRAEGLSGLPPAYLMIGELDLMRGENIEYAMRLMQAGVPTELHIYPGAFHGFEGLVPNAAVSVRAVNEYTEALKRGLSR